METKGHFQITPCLQEHHARYLHGFAQIRHMYWENEYIEKLPDPLRDAVGLPVGDGGLYVVNIDPLNWDAIFMYAKNDGNTTPLTPGFYCPLIPTEDRCGLMWDGGETDDDWLEWLAFLRTHFLDRWGYNLSGEVLISYVSEEQLVEAKIVAGETIEFVLLKKHPTPTWTGGSSDKKDEEGDEELLQ